MGLPRRGAWRRARRLGAALGFVGAVCGLFRVLWVMLTARERGAAYDLVQRRLREQVARERGVGCSVPAVDPFSDEAMLFDDHVGPLYCPGEDWVQCYLSSCFVTPSIARRLTEVACAVSEVVPVSDERYFLGGPLPLRPGAAHHLLDTDLLHARCSAYQQTSSGKVKKRWSGFVAGYRPVTLPATPLADAPADAPNVLLLMFDSISRHQFIRRMPLSYKVLTEELDAVVMKNYNVVGEGSASALFPVLAGRDELEMMPRRETRPRVDPSPLLFALLKEQGYRTAYHEDMPWISSFNHLYGGFEEPPTDHYLRPLFQEAIYRERTQFLRTGLKKNLFCFGARPLMDFMLNYTAQMFDLPGKKFCLMFSNTYSHDHMDSISMVDKDLAAFLRRFRDDGHLENSALFVMSDHGPKFQGIRSVQQGRLEERLPLLAVVLPRVARPAAARHLRAAASVLTTPYDVHTTILDLLGLAQHRNTYRVPGASIERGLSMLRPIPESRSCAEAGVLPYWCACARWRPLPRAHALFPRIGKAIASYINYYTQEMRKLCFERSLTYVEWVMVWEPPGGVGSTGDSRSSKEIYLAKLYMGPDIASFEGSVEYSPRADAFVVSHTDISRTNAYGNEPSCIIDEHPHLNKFCYCNVSTRVCDAREPVLEAGAG